MQFVFFAIIFLLWFFITKQIVYWETLLRFGNYEETPELFIYKFPVYIYFSYFLWIINFVYLLFLPYKKFSISIFICISFLVGIMGRFKALKKRDEIKKELISSGEKK